MKVTENKQTGLKKDYNIVIPAEDVNKKYDEKLTKLASEAKIQGFRPGKVPASVLKARFGASIFADILDEMLNESIGSLYQEQKIQPAMQPKVEVITFEEGKDFEFSIALEVLPEIPEIDFTKIKVKKVFTEVEDSQIDKQLEVLAKAKRDSKTLDADASAKEGNIAVIDFVGSIDGKEFEGGKGNAYPLELGSGSFIPGFEEQLIGKKAGEEVIVKVNFPEDYQAKELAGKPAEFKVNVKELREMTPMNIDDSLAKAFGKNDLAELKNLLKEEISASFDSITQSHLKRAILDALADEYKFEIPECLKKAEFDAIWEQAKKEAEMKKQELPETEKAEYEDIADRRVRLGLILTEIGKKNKVQPTSADINRVLINEARRYPGQEKLFFEFYQKNKNFSDSINSQVFEDKVVSFIAEQVTVEPVKVSEEELYSYYSDEQEEAKEKPAAKGKGKAPAKSAEQSDTKKEDKSKAETKEKATPKTKAKTTAKKIN